MMESELVELLSNTVTIAPLTSRDMSGKGSFGTAVTIAAHIQMGEVLTKDQEGKTVVGKGSIVMDGQVSVTNDSQLTLPDSSTPIIITVDTLYDEDGSVYATRVVFG